MSAECRILSDTCRRDCGGSWTEFDLSPYIVTKTMLKAKGKPDVITARLHNTSDCMHDMTLTEA